MRFGTGGWRGLRGSEVTPERLHAVLRGAAAWLARSAEGRPVVLGYDGRAGGVEMARCARAILGEAGLRVLESAGPSPTPALSSAVRRRSAAGALIVTASHNPPEYQGLKVVGPWGGSVYGDDARWIEETAGAALGRPAPSDEGAAGTVDLVAEYREALAGELAPVERPVRVAYDAMHGAGAGVLDRVLADAGVAVTLLRGERAPDFGGTPPDPRPERIGELCAVTRGLDGLRLGLANDGDADRLAAIDGTGRVLSETEVLALVIEHGIRTGRVRTGVAISMATGSLVERLAGDHGLAVVRRPLGFARLSRALADGLADAAGEESGGFALERVGRDKDGMLAGLLLVERVAADGVPLEHALAALEHRYGKSACARRALPATPERCGALARLAARPPDRLGGQAVQDVWSGDGTRLDLADGFLMLRASQTEPVLRLYAEAPGPEALARRLALGKALLDGS